LDRLGLRARLLWTWAKHRRWRSALGTPQHNGVGHGHQISQAQDTHEADHATDYRRYGLTAKKVVNQDLRRWTAMRELEPLLQRATLLPSADEIMRFMSS